LDIAATTDDHHGDVPFTDRHSTDRPSRAKMIPLSQLLADFAPDRLFTVPPDWCQGRTAYGGLSAALAVQAAQSGSGLALPPLRSAHFSFIGPATGDLGFRTQVLRQGKSAVSVSVDVLAGEQVATRAALVFAHPRASRVAHDFSSRPQAAGPDDCRPFGPEAKQVAPVFAQNFEMRPAGGARPISNAAHPELLWWVRHVDARGIDPAVALVALADAMPPAAITCFVEPAPISTMTWSIDLPVPATAGEWYLMRSFSRQAGDGYSFQEMEVWDEHGRSVMWGRQTVAIFA
jgi:acyl-CoA thioesterase